MPRNETGSTTRRGLLRAGAAGAATTAAVAAGSGTAAAAYDGYLDDVDNYEGTYDYRGQEEVHVDVGAGSGLLYDPPAILIDPGTTVVWEWTGEGGGHDVVEQDEAFASDRTAEAGHTFEHTFDDVSEGDFFRYVCVPHEAVNMKGVVAIGETDDELIDPDGGDRNGPDDGAGNGPDDGGGLVLTADDLVAIALGLGLVGALLIPLFYAASKRSGLDRQPRA